MLDKALEFIKSVLDARLKDQLGVDADTCIVNSLVDAEGAALQANQNKIVLTLINLENETAKQFYGGRQSVAGQVQQVNPAVRFNLDVLFTANFDVYSEALKFLSATIAFFQSFQVINRQQFPNLPQGIQQLQFEIENSPYQQSHNVWSALGAKYQPSIIYKIRHLSIQTNEIKGTETEVSDVSDISGGIKHSTPSTNSNPNRGASL